MRAHRPNGVKPEGRPQPHRRPTLVEDEGASPPSGGLAIVDGLDRLSSDSPLQLGRVTPWNYSDRRLARHECVRRRELRRRRARPPTARAAASSFSFSVGAAAASRVRALAAALRSFLASAQLLSYCSAISASVPAASDGSPETSFLLARRKATQPQSRCHFLHEDGVAIAAARRQLSLRRARARARLLAVAR